MTSSFRTIVADPPWPYASTSTSKKLKGYVQDQYAVLSLAELAALPVAALGADYLALWTTGAFIFDAPVIFAGWGFRPVTTVVWAKLTSAGNPAYGPGYWFRSSAEFIVIGKRPGARSLRTHERNIFNAPVARHSAKPEAFQDLVERHFPGPYLELFARRARPGWTCLGNELTGNDLAVDLARLS